MLLIERFVEQRIWIHKDGTYVLQVFDQHVYTLVCQRAGYHDKIRSFW